MKTVVIGDIHGRPIWKQIISNENPDRVIFMGDYFDAYYDYTAAEQMYNFNEIIQYKLSGHADVVMLVGNHDYHYMPGIIEQYSGYQHGARVAIEHLLYENKVYLEMAFEMMGGFLFSHAGISQTWLDYHEYNNDEYPIVSWVNNMWKYKPNIFGFVGRDPYGDSEHSSPIWIRPKSLQRANYDTLRTQFIQVVGHTEQKKIDIEGKSTGGRYYYIDTLGTSGEYMIIEDSKISFKQINK